jgi:hypothetical protein
VQSLILASSNVAAPDVGNDQRDEALADCPWQVYGEEIGPWMDGLVCRYRSLSHTDPQIVDVNGIRTRYYESGSGEPMILLHGAPCTNASWTKACCKCPS